MSESATELLYVKLARAYRLSLRPQDDETARMYAQAFDRMADADTVVETAIERFDKMPSIAQCLKLSAEISGQTVLSVPQYVPVIEREAAEYAALRRSLDAPEFTEADALEAINAQSTAIVADYDMMGVSGGEEVLAFSNRAAATHVVARRRGIALGTEPT